jgi:putative flippase GtrA
MTPNELAVRLVARGSARREAPRILRFGAVGATNTVITLAVFAALVALGCPAPAASGLGFCAGAANSFHLNRRWTFSDFSTARGAWVRFGGIQGVGALVSAAGVSMLQRGGWGHLVAECAILPCVTVALYSVSRLLVFRSASI